MRERGVRVSAHVACEHICRQKGRNPSQGLAARIPLPGTDFQMPHSQVPITAFAHLWGLATSTRIPLSPHRSHREAQNGSRKLSQIWSLTRETGCPVASGAVALFPLQPLASYLVQLLFNIPLLSLGSMADCPPSTPAGTPGTLSALCWHVLHPGLFWFQPLPTPWG